MAAEIRDPTEDTGTGAEITDIGTRRHSITGTAQYSVADVAEVETETTLEAAVHEGDMVQTPTPPTNTCRKLRAEDRPVAKEVGWRRRNDGLVDRDKIFVRLSISAHRIVRPAIAVLTVRSAIGAHSTLMRPAIVALTVRSAIGAHRILVRPAIAALTVRPAITALTGY